jgi:phage shock protein PspC (stress-responsive transcriptional regulator)
MKRIYLSRSDRKIGGVCGGIGEYFDKDPTLIRVIYILLTLFSFGFGMIAYLAMWLIIPRKPEETVRRDDDKAMPGHAH